MTHSSKKILWILMIIASACSSGCVQYSQYKQAQQAYVAEADYLAPFSTIAITGNANVELTQGATSAIFITGQKQYVENVNATVINHTLYINKNTSSPVVIKLQTAYVLNNILVSNNSNLSGKNFASKNLTISASNSANINLNGEFDVANINQTGNGKIEIQWINSDNLKITSHNQGHIYLAGTVDNLTGYLFNSSSLEARYLRAKQATIMTTNYAMATIFAIKTLNAYADNNSGIFYYKRPLEFNKVTKDSGNALLLEELK